MTHAPQIKQILFDCDNTLVLSEHLAFEACAELANELLAAHGLPDRYTPASLLAAFVGQNFRGMLLSLASKHSLTISPSELDALVDRELGAVIEKLEARAEPCPGAPDVLAALAQDGQYGLAVVSSSALPRVEASLRTVGMDRYFPPGTVFSAASSLEKPTSKPDPAVYVFACARLGVRPGECVAVEDSRSGATAARNAGIPLVGYVGPYEEGEERERMERVLREECGARYVMRDWSEFFEALRTVEAGLQSESEAS